MLARHRFIRLAAAIGAAGLVACTPADQQSSEEGAAAGEAAASGDAVLEVTAKDFEYDAPEEIPSGWTTVRLTNDGEQEHFVLLWKLPEGKTPADYRREVAVPFMDVWERYDAGHLSRQEVARALGEELPEWYFTQVTPKGGVGLTEPGDTREATVELDPGTYVLECYVKTPQGTWHSYRGMLRGLTVTSESNGVAPPEADVEIRLSNYEISAPERLPAGEHTFAVHVEENPEGMLMHDVNLIRLEEGTSLDSVAAWMDWMDLEEFRSPAPGYALGGVKHMVAGNTAYTTLELAPGRYAWVSEGYASRGMIHPFTVVEGEATDG